MRIHAFVDAYRAAFAAFDAPAIAELFSYPCQVTGAADEVTVTTVESREAWVPELERLVAAYRTIGVRAAEALRTDVFELAPRLVQATVHWRLLDAEGRRIYDFDASYTVADLAGGMRITAIAHNETPRLRARVPGPRRNAGGPDEQEAP